MSIIRFDNVDVIFAKDPREALRLLDEGIVAGSDPEKNRADRRR
jgi:ABC-type proline/glycine betaine transport system ATPase subunit